MQMTMFAKNCFSCDVELGDYNGRNRYEYQFSHRKVEVCDHCFKDFRSGLSGEIAAADGTIYGYHYLPNSRVVSFHTIIEDAASTNDEQTHDDECECEICYPSESNESGAYDFKSGSTFWVAGEKPYPHLDEIAALFVAAHPDPHADWLAGEARP